MYAVINDVINGNSPAVDIQSIDITKCFDEMWFAETHNDLFDVKVKDDKFALIAKLDEKADVVVKTPCGNTDQFTLENIVMQGSVFGPIKCTIQIDTLGRDCQQYNQGCFKYKNVLSITPLSLIDDCIGFSKCGADAVELNAILNTKIISKKLRLSADKCTHMHVSKSGSNCYSNLKADNVVMKKSTVCSYLGDTLCTSGSMDATIESRRQKGVGICSQIMGIVDGLSLGHFYYKISFLFRDCKLLNGILTNAEIWHPLSDNQIEVLENVDLMLIRKLLKGHSKAPKETFFIETGLLPTKFVIMKRRIMYLHNILIKPKSELIRKVYEVQKSLFTKHDWYNLVMQNRNELQITQTDEQIGKMSKERFSSIVTKAIGKRTADYLNNIAQHHSKAKPLMKQTLKQEEYFQDSRFSKSEIELLFALRTRMVNGIRNNFPTMNNISVACQLCFVHIDCQEHLLKCVELSKHVKIPTVVDYSDLFKDCTKQLRIVKLFKSLLRTREILSAG